MLCEVSVALGYKAMAMLGRNLEKTLRRMLQLANERQHEYATIETLLLVFLKTQTLMTLWWDAERM
jgi:hypothetical protein